MGRVIMVMRWNRFSRKIHKSEEEEWRGRGGKVVVEGHIYNYVMGPASGYPLYDSGYPRCDSSYPLRYNSLPLHILPGVDVYKE